MRRPGSKCLPHPGGLVESLRPARIYWTTALGTALYEHWERIRFFVQFKKGKAEGRNQLWACHPVLGSDGLFTNMTCCHSGKKPPQRLTNDSEVCSRFHDVLARSGHTAPIPQARGSSPPAPTAGERPVKRVGVPVTLLCNP